MEEVYDLMQCTDEQKFWIAVHMLTNDASIWWKFISRKQSPRVELTWEDFKREFNRKYYSRVHREQKRKEFLELTSGSKTVAKYETAFTNLSRYAALLVTDEEEKCQKFLD